MNLPDSRSGRARPLGKDDRRAAIVAATIPLILEHGAGVTTRQIAEASGVAEGTLFRAFGDKDELLRVAILQALDPEPTLEAIRALPPSDRLAGFLPAMTQLLFDGQRKAIRLLGAAHQILGVPGRKPPGAANADHPGPGHHDHAAHHQAGSRGDIRTRSAAMVNAEIAEQLRPYADELRLSPEHSARVLFSLVVGNSLPIVVAGGSLEVEHIVDVVLHGIGQDPVHVSPSALWRSG